MADELTIAENDVVATSTFGLATDQSLTGQSFDCGVTAFVTSGLVRVTFIGGAVHGEALLHIYEVEENYLPANGSSPIATSAPIPTEDLNNFTDQDETFIFDGTVQLIQGQRYAVILTCDVANVNIKATNASGYTPGGMCLSNDGGADWGDFSGYDLRFNVLGSEGGGGGGGGGGLLPTEETLFESWGF